MAMPSVDSTEYDDCFWVSEDGAKKFAPSFLMVKVLSKVILFLNAKRRLLFES